MLFGNIVCFAAIVGEVVEFPQDRLAAIVIGYQFPRPATNGGVRLMLPEDRAILHFFCWAPGGKEAC